MVADFPPALAVMVVFPLATPVTTPFTTVAMALSPLSQVSASYVASLGSTLAVRLADAPTLISRSSLGEMVTCVTGTVTTTWQLAVLPLVVVAVMVASPPPVAVTTPDPLTVATDLLLLVHETVLKEASSGSRLATRVKEVPPFSRASSVSLSEMDSTGTTGNTVTLQVAETSPARAVMVAVPGATPVTTPYLLTVAAALLSVLHSVASVLLDGVTMSTSILLSVSNICRFAGLTVIPVAGMMRLATVTVQVALVSPALAVMVAVPGATAVTFPALSTVANSGLSLLQVTVGLEASSGFTVADRVASSPSTRSKVALSRVTELTGTVTVTLQVAECSPALAIMVASPPPTAFTLPSATVTTSALEVLQVTVLLVASSGFTVAARVVSCPLIRFRVLLSRETEVTSITFLETATVQVAVLSPALAVMVAVPSFTAVTLPVLSTVAISALSVLQATVLSVASLGDTVADN